MAPNGVLRTRDVRARLIARTAGEGLTEGSDERAVEDGDRVKDRSGLAAFGPGRVKNV